jgi:hypothetical protein
MSNVTIQINFIFYQIQDKFEHVFNAQNEVQKRLSVGVENSYANRGRNPPTTPNDESNC